MAPPSTPVAVLGLGAMGSALARALLAAGHPTTVWNRTAQRAEPLVALGAQAAPDPAAAVAAADVVLTSLVDGAAVTAVLTAAAPALRGTAVVELTSLTPREAEAIGTLVEGAGASYVSGSVMVTPPMIATADASLLLGGDRAAYERIADVLRALAPNLRFVGDAAATALLDMGMLDVFFGAVTSFVHAATLAGTGGVKPTEFLEHGEAMLRLALASTRELAAELTAGSYPGDENSIAMMRRSIDHVVETAEERGVDPALPQVTARLMGDAVDRGYGGEGYGRIADLLRR
ncbi:MAG TPA: NAD(P)-binding domain-containing protein [Acidimicrobiales bacterium]